MTLNSLTHPGSPTHLNYLAQTQASPTNTPLSFGPTANLANILNTTSPTIPTTSAHVQFLIKQLNENQNKQQTTKMI